MAGSELTSFMCGQCLGRRQCIETMSCRRSNEIPRNSELIDAHIMQVLLILNFPPTSL